MKLFKINNVTRVPSDNILEIIKLKRSSMKKLLYFTIVVSLLFSCTTQSSHGHLIGAMVDPFGIKPILMVCYIFLLVHLTWAKVIKMFL